jgi:hypothetical protein
MTPTHIEGLRSWIGEVSGAESVELLDSVWAEFAAREQPVATLFGAFDTGKSSILRRLLVDSGQQVPDWLTISARHETFSDQLVDVGGCAVRDTPGLSPDGQDARSLKNSRVARATLGLTDVLLVTVNPQLPTGERAELLGILSQGWPDSCVWFLVSRADEGGVDPTLDPAGFEDWAQRKREELRDSLDLNEASLIYVLVPDFGQLGAFVIDPEPSTWDVSRPWDGMDQLRAALVDLAGKDFTASRAAAEQRFWRIAVSERLAGVRTELENLKTSRDAAANSLRRKNLFLQQLDSLVEAARVSLEGAIEDAIRRVLMRPQVDAGTIQNTVDPLFEQWWQEQQTALARIRQDAIRAFDQQRAGRGWATFESLYSSLYTADPEDSSGERSFTPQFEKLGRKAVEALKAVDGVRQAHRAVKQPAQAAELAKSAPDLGQVAGIATALLPLAVELAGLIEDKVQDESDKARKRARRQQVEDEVTRIVQAAAEQAMNNLAPDVDALRQEISEQTIEQIEVNDLEVAVEGASDLISRGEAFLQA